MKRAIVCGGRLDGKRLNVEGTQVLHKVVDDNKLYTERYTWHLVGNEMIAVYQGIEEDNQ